MLSLFNPFWGSVLYSAGGGTPSEIVAPSNAVTYLHADSGLVLSGSDVTDWQSDDLAVGSGGPYDWTQSTSADRGQVTTAVFSGSRQSVTFDGSTDHMLADAAVAPLFQGTADFTRMLHCVVISQAANDNFFAFGDTASSLLYEIVRDTAATDGPYSILGRGTLNPGIQTGSGTYGNEEIIIWDVKEGTNRRFYVENSGGLTKVLDITYDRGTISALSSTCLAAWLYTALAGPMNMSVRRHGIWNIALSDAQVTATSPTLFGT